MKKLILTFLGVMTLCGAQAEPLSIGGIYPSLAYYNQEGECGTGAVVPWADNLWVITYGPHCPVGSSDKLYQITPDKKLIIRPESVGGTPANRLIHRESNQLLIGTYLIDSKGSVRTVPIHTMPGRLTAAARHLTDPQNKVYVSNMEEGLYELDVNTLETRVLIHDGHNAPAYLKLFKEKNLTPPKGWDTAENSDLFGYHGKGTCTGFGRLYYSNNGQYGEEATVNPAIPSGALAYWQPGQSQMTAIRTNQFTEITTRDGIYGNEHPTSNPIWAMGWDAKSIILTVTTDGINWSDYRLPKASHSYDGAHGWNTEWPRIREIGKGDEFLATMHGTFWKFPATFKPGNTAGVRPRSNYLKVIGDFCQWQGKVILGCDDSAHNEFLNKRKVKGTIQGPARSHSNLWFVDEPELDTLGPAIGNAFVWWKEPAEIGQASAPYLVGGYDLRWLWISEGTFDIQLDAKGNGSWESIGTYSKGGHDLSAIKGEWIRLIPLKNASLTTVTLHQRKFDTRPTTATRKPYTIALPDPNATLLHVNSYNYKALSIASPAGTSGFTLDEGLNLQTANNATNVQQSVPLVRNAVTAEPASILYRDDKGKSWRLPYGTSDRKHLENSRVCREICTERDHFNAGGVYYELPAENAHGFAGLRPITTHNLPIIDYASWRGLFAYTTHGAINLLPIDHFWHFGKARGFGGPWLKSEVKAEVPSDPYILNGFDYKTVKLLSSVDQAITLQVDVDGWGTWVDAYTFELKAGQSLKQSLPRAFSGYWLRFAPSVDSTVSAQLIYE